MAILDLYIHSVLTSCGCCDNHIFNAFKQHLLFTGVEVRSSKWIPPDWKSRYWKGHKTWVSHSEVPWEKPCSFLTQLPVVTLTLWMGNFSSLQCCYSDPGFHPHFSFSVSDSSASFFNLGFSWSPWVQSTSGWSKVSAHLTSQENSLCHNYMTVHYMPWHKSAVFNGYCWRLFSISFHEKDFWRSDGAGACC